MSVATGFHLCDQHLRCPSCPVQEFGNSLIETEVTNSDEDLLFLNQHPLYSVVLSYPVQ